MVKSKSKERRALKKERFTERLEQAQTNALKAKAAIGKKKGKRKGLSKAFQDFSDFSKTLDGATLTASGAKTRRGPKKASITQERERLAAVVSHPQFQVNPLRAVQNHLKHTLASATATPPSAIALKSKKKADAVTEAQKKQMRYRKKMEKQTDKQMDVA